MKQHEMLHLTLTIKSILVVAKRNDLLGFTLEGVLSFEVPL